jgi:hypothetical protein
MSSLLFNLSIIKRDQRVYIARADELGTKSKPASTKRGAIKALKKAVLLALTEAGHAL